MMLEFYIQVAKLTKNLILDGDFGKKIKYFFTQCSFSMKLIIKMKRNVMLLIMMKTETEKKQYLICFSSFV